MEQATTQSSYRRAFHGVIASAALLLTACATANESARTPVTDETFKSAASLNHTFIAVMFDGDCPVEVDYPIVTVTRGVTKSVTWLAVDGEGDWDKTKEFFVFFHPFTGGWEEAKNGKAKLKADNGVPSFIPGGPNVQYKYTIAHPDADSGCTPVDPYFRVY